MFLKLLFVTVFTILLVCYESCFSTFQQFKFPRNSYFDQNIHANNGTDQKSQTYVKQYEYHAKPPKPAGADKLVVNVDDFGAKANGRDDSEAFRRAWKEVCSSTKQSVLVVPAKKEYYVKPITFRGPCKAAGITMNVHGTISASKHFPDYEKAPRNWLKFKRIKDFTVEGGGTFNGNGQIWWPQSCKIDKTKPCKTAPTALIFERCQNLKVKHLTIKSAQQMHLTFHGCTGVETSHIKVNSDPNSPNTDGIHVSGTQNIHISHSDIQTGDDCISIVSGSHQVKATDIKCGPGHGISIGGLGKKGKMDFVSNILVNRATFSGTTNGVRIKSWQGGRGTAEKIIFQNIAMKNVRNPMIINQYYCDKIGKNCPMKREAVQVRNVVFKNIRGTSAEDEGIVFNCSRTVPCQGIMLQNVQLTYKGRSSTATCADANVAEIGNVVPQCPKK